MNSRSAPEGELLNRFQGQIFKFTCQSAVLPVLVHGTWSFLANIFGEPRDNLSWWTLNEPVFWERKKHKEKKTRKQNVHGIVPGFWGDFVYVFSPSPIRNDPKKTHKQMFATHPVPGQSRKFVHVYVCFFP